MKHLIIIGNGFDLAHGLKTDYNSFVDELNRKWQNREKSNLLKLINKQKQINNWCDIEYLYFQALQGINNNELKMYGFHFHNYSVKNLNDEMTQLKDELEKYLSVQQYKAKFDYLYHLLFNEFNGQDAVVLNFNYTNTLNNYLDGRDIEQIHIHGDLHNHRNPIIFGFAPDEDSSKALLTENNNEYVRHIKKFNYLFTKNEQKLKEHLESEHFNIYILGHSCGISDQLILSQIFNAKGVNKIYPFYYKNREGYFQTMVNIDRIIDDYSKNENKNKAFNKLESFPNCCDMPQIHEKNQSSNKYSNYVESLIGNFNDKFSIPSHTPLLIDDDF